MYGERVIGKGFDSLWAIGYYCGSAGHVSQEAVKRYVQEQEGKDVFEYSVFGNPEQVVSVNISRTWAMPNKNTFQIKPIGNLISKYRLDNISHGLWLDPFPYPYQEDALVYLAKFHDNFVEGVLFDPPYSPRQLKECYQSYGMALHDTKSSVWSNWKDEIARVIKPGGLCISFGWSSNGLGKSRGFEIVEILMVAHGGNHNDTICVVEKKLKEVTAEYPP